MTQEEKQLLLKDLCARWPYGVKINIRNDYTLTMEDIKLNAYHLSTASYDIEYRGLRPYLRPMSSMTEEEEKVFNDFLEFQAEYVSDADLDNKTDMYDWLNTHHFDYRGLIEKGLALKASEGMYKDIHTV